MNIKSTDPEDIIRALRANYNVLNRYGVDAKAHYDSWTAAGPLTPGRANYLCAGKIKRMVWTPQAGVHTEKNTKGVSKDLSQPDLYEVVTEVFALLPTILGDDRQIPPPWGITKNNFPERMDAAIQAIADLPESNVYAAYLDTLSSGQITLDFMFRRIKVAVAQTESFFRRVYDENSHDKWLETSGVVPTPKAAPQAGYVPVEGEW